MKIYHNTDLESALNIVKTRTFYALNNSIYHGDSGLNSFPLDDSNFNTSQYFYKKGVCIIFEWTGEIEKDVSIHFPRKDMEINTMYIQGAWRCFIPFGNDPKYLKVIGIKCEDRITDLHKELFKNKDIHISIV